MNKHIESFAWSRAAYRYVESFSFISRPMSAHTVDPTFGAVIGFVLNSEGGYVDNPKDPGGPTMRGVAWNYNAGWLKANGYTRSTLRNLTKEDAIRCYYERYWLPSDAEGITSEDLAYVHLDSAINHGCGKAAEFLKKLPTNPKMFDFRGGKNKELEFKLFGNYLAMRMKYFAQIRHFDEFGRGWMNRCADVLLNAVNKIA